MLLNKVAGQAGRTLIEGETYRALADKVMNSTVLLQGSGSAPIFIGSGVILGAGKEVTYSGDKWNTTAKNFTVVVSALHNVFINAKQGGIPPLSGSDITWNQTWADNFGSQVKIKYGPSGMDWGKAPSGSAAINHVVPIFQSNIGVDGKMITVAAVGSGDGQEFQLVNLNGATSATNTGGGGKNAGITPVSGAEAESWSYDLVLLLSTDASLYTYATTAGACDFMAGLNFKTDIAQKLLPDWDNPPHDGQVPVLKASDYKLAQFGYGETSDPDVPVKGGSGKTKRPEAPSAGAVYQKLQYKKSQAQATTTADNFYLNTEHKLPNNNPLVIPYNGGLMLDCDGGNNSTYSGDSGGPIVAFPVAGGANAYLLGVNTGAGVATSESSATDGSVWEYDNNVATSMGKFFDELNDLRFQSV